MCNTGLLVKTNKSHNRVTQSGFTLIELIIVIVILGILAVVAAPRFMSISSDANKASLDGLHGAIFDANRLLCSKAVLQDLHKQT